jgi:hypothetical protein
MAPTRADGNCGSQSLNLRGQRTVDRGAVAQLTIQIAAPAPEITTLQNSASVAAASINLRDVEES